MPSITNPLVGSRLVLNIHELVDFLGSAEAISALGIILIHPDQRWLGWYNIPGSLDIVRYLANLASSLRRRPHEEQSLIALLGLGSRVGARFIPAFSESHVETGYLGYLAVERSREIGRVDEMMSEATASFTTFLLELEATESGRHLLPRHAFHTLLAFIPIATSVATCILCALVSDFIIASVILAGMLINGTTHAVIGSGRLVLDLPSPPLQRSPHGSGILISGDTVVVVRGEEPAVGALTGGRFKLEGGKHWEIWIRHCSLLHLAGGLVQLFVASQGTLFGQFMFAISVGVSTIYNYFLSSFKESHQAELLFSMLGETRVRGFPFRTSTSRAVFACLLLFHRLHHRVTNDSGYDHALAALPLDTTPVWVVWKTKVVNQLHYVHDRSLSYLKIDDRDRARFSLAERTCLQGLLNDAAAAFRRYHHTFMDSSSAAR